VSPDPVGTSVLCSPDSVGSDLLFHQADQDADRVMLVPSIAGGARVAQSGRTPALQLGFLQSDSLFSIGYGAASPVIRPH